MGELTDSQVYQEVGKIVSQFELHQCYECARADMQWLTDNEIEGKAIELRTRCPDEDYILSDRVGSWVTAYLRDEASRFLLRSRSVTLGNRGFSLNSSKYVGS